MNTSLKSNPLVRVLLFAALLVGAGGPALAADAPARPKVLVVTGGHGFHRELFFQMFAANTNITFAEAQQSKTSSDAYDREDLFTYDTVVLYDMVQHITDAQKARFRALFERGIGLVVLHHALVSYQHWPDYERIIGGRYPEEDGKSGVVTTQVGYQHDVDVPVIIVATNHPITSGLKDFTIHDEIYWGFRVQADVTPILSTTHPRSGKPLAWTRTEGKSRVVYLQPGHDRSAYENPNFRKLVAQSIRWTAKR